MPRWYDWLTRANDPEARRLIAEARARIDEVLARLDRLYIIDGHVYLAPPLGGSQELDCEHNHNAFAVYRDGKTTCYLCYNPRRGNPRGAI